MSESADDILVRAHRFLRSHTKADLRFEEHFRPLRYVFAPDGRLVAPVMVAMLQSVDTVLYIPETVDDAMEVQVTLEQFEERGEAGALADRWRIYHGEPQDMRWAIMGIDSARFEDHVIDGAGLAIPNPLASDEARLCRWVNQEHAAELHRLCDRLSPMKIEEPKMVGIDPTGIDVRARFDVVHLSVEQTMNTPEEARAVLSSMLQQP